MQDLIAPELRAIGARVDALGARIDEHARNGEKRDADRHAELKSDI